MNHLSQPDADARADLLLDWEALRSTGDCAARNRIIDCYLPFARMLAAKTYARRTYAELEFQDYFQCATLGLMEAVDRFDPGYGAKFEAFSEPRITGAILNGIDSLSEKQQQVSARKRAIAARVESVKGEEAPPTNSMETLFGYLAQIAVGMAVGFVLEDSGMFQADAEPAYADNTYQSVELKQLRKRMLKLVDTLPQAERRVISYHYLQQHAFTEIAAMLGVSKGRVSQIHRHALELLKEKIRHEGAIDLNF